MYALITTLWVLTLAGIQSVPLEAHEGFVLASAQEMKSSGDWTVPRFNGELRLQKPPLNYWATLCVSALDPFTRAIQIYHGRMVSMLAGLAMALLAARTSSRFYGRETGLTAGMLFLCTNGFLHFSHNARPDALYAAFCTLQLFAWIESWREADNTARQRGWAWLGWAAAALATLAKGPQVPVLFLVGLVVHLAPGNDRRRMFSILRPFSGAALFCLLVLPWWLTIHHRLHGLGVDLADSQLSGSLLGKHADWKAIFSLYYLWACVAQMLPASLLGLLLLPVWIRRRPTLQPVSRLLCTVASVLLIAFTLGGQYRRHYVLPLIPVFSVLLARGLHTNPLPGLRVKALKGLASLGLLAGASCAGLMFWSGACAVPLSFAALSLLIVHLLKLERGEAIRDARTLTAQLPVMLAGLVFLGAGFYAYAPLSPRRALEQDFFKHVGTRITEDDRLVSLKTSVGVLPFYTETPVMEFPSAIAVHAFFELHHDLHPVYAILQHADLHELNARFKIRVLRTAMNQAKPDTSLCLVQLLAPR